MSIDKKSKHYCIYDPHFPFRKERNLVAACVCFSLRTENWPIAGSHVADYLSDQHDLSSVYFKIHL